MVAILLISMVLVIIACIIALVVAGGVGVSRYAESANAPLLFAPVRVVDKRESTHSTYSDHPTVYTNSFVTFELPDGNRIELVVKGNAYGLIARDDTGTLWWQGRWFKGFQRDLPQLPATQSSPRDAWVADPSWGHRPGPPRQRAKRAWPPN